jgi:hypothetical protein
MTIAKVLDNLGKAISASSAVIFPDMMNVERPTASVTGSGAATTVFAGIPGNAVNIPCVMDVFRTGQEMVSGESLQNVTFVQIHCPTSVKGVVVTVSSKDRLRLIARGTEVERVVQVREVNRLAGVGISIYGSYKD